MKTIKKLILSIFFVVFFTLFNYTVQAASIDYNIDAIDETKYPGFKSQIKEMQTQYPNWTFKVLYTGLNWDDVIAGEYVGHGGTPSSLIQNTYNCEWICPICGDTLYDVSKEWYCASEKAIKYMMDPRNSLTEDYIFQFQDLSSSAGARTEVAKMTEGTFLNNDECIDAILNSAQTHSISPFHLVARIRQEQGVDGTGSLNGYTYTTEEGNEVVVYNLFNIKVSGNSAEGIVAGAKFAYEQGWTTRAASIEGGAKFLREKYLDKGQSTLYFQKYNVVDQTNLYKHQYMQNIRAANDEGNIVYKGYKNNGMLNSHFEFTIPLYENMPTNKCARPLNKTDLYYGSIASELIKIKLNQNSSGLQYISGNIVIVEWISGVSSVPKTTPKITIESTDGTIVKQMYVKQISGNTYYFDGYINELDKNKEYQIYAELTNANNIGTNKRTLINLPDTALGKDDKVDIVIKDSKLRYQYEGGLTNELKTLSLSQTEDGRYYISGEVLAIEWVNGKSTVPTDTPKVTLVSIDGEKQLNTFVTPTGTNTYYFDIFIDNVDTTKQYKLKIELTTEYNISTNKTNTINISKMPTRLGKINSYYVMVQDNTITFKDNSYVGNINSELITFNVGKNQVGATYVSGQVVVVEWVDGKSTVPKIAPKMRFKSIDETINMEVFVTATGTNTYYFDRFIEGIDTSKEYYFEIESGDENNISENRSMNVYFTQTKYNDTIVGEYKGKNIRLLKQKILFEDDTYIGNINSELITFNVGQNQAGATYISGQVVVVEWVDGESTVPEVAPKMKFKSTDGEVELEVFVTPTGTNTYYFDRFIEGIDTSKEYYFEIESGDEKNVSENRSMNVYFTETKYNDTIVGQYQDQNIRLLEQKIIFEKALF